MEQAPATAANRGLLSRMTFRRRWFQFSLRGLLVLLTVFAIGLGWKVERARKQYRAIEAIEKVGGAVLYGSHGTPDDWNTQFYNFRLIPLAAHRPKRTWLETQFSDFEFREVTGVVIRTTKSRWFHHGPGGSGGVGVESEERISENEMLAAIPCLLDLHELRTIYLEGATEFNGGVRVSDLVEDRLRAALPRCQIIRDRMQMATNAPAAD